MAIGGEEGKVGTFLQAYAIDRRELMCVWGVVGETYPVNLWLLQVFKSLSSPELSVAPPAS